MRTSLPLFVFFLLLAISACKKNDRVPTASSEYLGDFDYKYSTDASSYIDCSALGHYGIRVMEKGKIHVFKDGQLTGEGSVVSCSYSGLSFDLDGTEYSIVKNGDEAVSNYPLTDKQNYYAKIK